MFCLQNWRGARISDAGLLPSTQVDSLHTDKRNLDKVLEHRQAELDDVHSRLKAAMVHIHPLRCMSPENWSVIMNNPVARLPQATDSVQTGA